MWISNKRTDCGGKRLGKKIFLSWLCMMLFLPGLGLANTSAGSISVSSGTGEPLGPSILDSTIGPAEAHAGDTITITAKLSAPTDTIKNVQAHLAGETDELVDMAYNKVTDTWTGTYRIKDYNHQGVWYLRFYLYNENDNYWYRWTKNYITVINPNEDRVMPEVSSLQIEPQPVEAGTSFKLTVKAVDNIGVKSIKADFLNREVEGWTTYGPRLTYDSKRDEWTGSFLFEKNTVPEKWTVRLAVMDLANNEKIVLKDFELSNPDRDITPPQADQIKIDKQTVYQGENVKVTAKITDDKSGVRSATFMYCNKIWNCNIATLQKNNGTGLWEMLFRIYGDVEPGKYSLMIQMIDNASNVSYAYLPETLEVIKDIIPPAKPVLLHEVTNRSKVIRGTTEAFAAVGIFIGTREIAHLSADEDGSFWADIPLQAAGTKITVTAKDMVGNVSQPTVVTVKDVIPPAVPVVNTVTNKATVISGKTEKSATVMAKIGTKTYSGKADTNGNYKIAIPVQNAGTKLYVSAKDGAGNVSQAKTVTVTKVAPNIPVVNAVNNKAVAVSGKAEANSVIFLKIGSKTFSGKTNAKGNFKVSIPVTNAGTVLSVTAKDRSGRISYARSMTVVRVAPNRPLVNAVRTYSTTVTGKTEKNVVITVKIGRRTYTAKANAYGNFQVRIPKQRKGTVIYVNAKDGKGAVSATTNVKVY